MTASTARVEAKLSELCDLSRTDLIERWKKKYRYPPPKGIKRGLLERAVAYQLQARKFGGLKPETGKALLAIAAGTEHQVSQTGSLQPNLKPGTRLVREWHGKPYQVIVTDTGFEWDGEEYSSLSAIAKAITGTKWSGPRFFGL